MYTPTKVWEHSTGRVSGSSFFLQGCPFRCLYCANPDTIDVKGGTPTTPEEILQMAISQKAFFGKKGGITFSGGELPCKQKR